MRGLERLKLTQQTQYIDQCCFNVGTASQWWTDIESTLDQCPLFAVDTPILVEQILDLQTDDRFSYHWTNALSGKCHCK